MNFRLSNYAKEEMQRRGTALDFAESVFLNNSYQIWKDNVLTDAFAHCHPEQSEGSRLILGFFASLGMTYVY